MDRLLLKTTAATGLAVAVTLIGTLALTRLKPTLPMATSAAATITSAPTTVAVAATADDGNPQRFNHTAPELVGGPWLNTQDGAPVKLGDLHGHVTIVHFWTFGCINCKHNLPSYNRWQKKFADKGVTIIGVHTPEGSDERITAHVRSAVAEHDIAYPILVDKDGTNWNRWGQRCWPAVYLIDKHGNVRYRWEGELEYNGANGEARMGALVEELLRER